MREATALFGQVRGEGLASYRCMVCSGRMDAQELLKTTRWWTTLVAPALLGGGEPAGPEGFDDSLDLAFCVVERQQLKPRATAKQPADAVGPLRGVVNRRIGWGFGPRIVGRYSISLGFVTV